MAEPKKVEEWFDGTERTLPNGIRLWAKQLSRLDDYYISLALPVGAECDPPNRSGLAHFLEHVAFRGGSRFPTHEAAAKYLTPWSEFPNGHTSRQCTRYDVTTPPELVLRALEVLVTLVFDHGLRDLELERSIILQERKNRLGRMDKITNDIVNAITTGDPRWQQLIIGTAEDLHAIDRESLAGFHDEWYRSGNVAGVMVGPREEPLMLDMFEAALSTVPERESTVTRLPPSPSIAIGKCSRRHWTEWGTQFPTALLAYSIPLPADQRFRRMALFVSHLFGHGAEAPLRNALRERSGLLYDFAIDIETSRGFFELSFTACADPERLPRVREAFESTVRHDECYRSSLFTVARERALRELTSNRFSGERIGWAKLGAMLEQREVPLRNDEIAEVGKVRPDDVREFVHAYLRPDAWHTVEIVP